MIEIPKYLQLILLIAILIYLLIFISINLFKVEYGDPPYNYLTKNWLNSPIKEIEILNEPENTNIKEYNNQKNLGFFKSGSQKKDLNIFKGKFFKIKTYNPYYYPNFVGYSQKKENNKKCGKDSQGNILYFPKDKECPLNFILITTNVNICENKNINCRYQRLNDNEYLVTSNENIDGIIITQIRINYENKICLDSSVDITFNSLLKDYEIKKCKEEYSYDDTYEKIGQEIVKDFLDNNNLKNMNIKNNDYIFLSYRGYLGVNKIDDYSEHPVDHVTYAKRIAFSKNIILFITWFFYAFCSIFIFYNIDNEKYFCFIKIIFTIYLIIFIFNFFYNFHVIFTFIRVRGIVSTVDLNGLNKYKKGLRWFIVLDIFIQIGIFLDFLYKLYKFLEFRKLFSRIMKRNYEIKEFN